MSAGIIPEDVTIPYRHVDDAFIDLAPHERKLYNRIEEYIRRHYNAFKSDQTTQALGFIMTVYRRRLTSSFEAIKKSLTRRLQVLEQGKSLGDLLTDDDRFDVGNTLFDPEAFDVSADRLRDEIHELRNFLADLDTITGEDTKAHRLIKDVNAALGGTYDSLVVFTQYSDTMDYVRERLIAAGITKIGCYSGRGGEVYDATLKTWLPVTKTDIKNRFRTQNLDEKLTVLIGTDSMSEGLNLQTSGRLINYDMPWNLMRVEQRIGRVDRIGALYEHIQVSNYFYADTVEQRVYEGIAEDYGDFTEIVGDAAPVLANVEKAIEQLALGDASDESIREHVDNIRGEVDDLKNRAVQATDMGAAPEITGHVNTPPDLTSDMNLANLEASLTSNALTGPLLQPNPDRPKTYRLALPAAAENYSCAPTAGAREPKDYAIADVESSDLLITFDRDTADEHSDDTTAHIRDARTRRPPGPKRRRVADRGAPSSSDCRTVTSSETIGRQAACQYGWGHRLSGSPVATLRSPVVDTGGGIRPPSRTRRDPHRIAARQATVGGDRYNPLAGGGVEMPLSGLVDGERVVSSLLSEEEWAALKEGVRAKRSAIEMPCGWPGIAKTSKLGTPYFAHKPGGDGCSAGETAQHLLAKAIIVEAIIAAGWEAEPEARGEGWIADVLATRNGVQVAFEVQWSNQTLDEYRHRQQRYRDAGIASIAWFARHTGHLPTADKTLPAFALAISEVGEATVQIDRTTLPLSEVVERLLTRRLQHRDYYANGQPCEAIVEGAVMECYRCNKDFGVWHVSEVRVRGRCGGEGSRGRGVGMFPEKRPETEPDVRAAGERLAGSMGVAPARLGRRYTRASETHYMAFICPHCKATCGEMFVANQFRDGSHYEANATLPPTALRQPHWCLAGDAGVCPVPPASVIDELAAADEVDSGWHGGAGVSVTPVGTPGGISIQQAVSRMFGGY